MTRTSVVLRTDRRRLHRERLVAMLKDRYDVGSPVHFVFVGTKPDIIKQYPVYKELERRGLQVGLFHSGQHTDHAYSGGMLEEFGLFVDLHVDLGRPRRRLLGRGPAEELTLGTRVSALMRAANELFAAAKVTGHTVIPYVHGDTATSMAVGVAAFVNQVACVHVEAGIRTLTPHRDFLLRHLDEFASGAFDWDAYLAGHRDAATYTRGSREPFPEQFNTRVSDCATGLHAAPVELDRTFLLDEGFPSEAIVVVGNTGVDAVLEAQERVQESTILSTFPQLEAGDFIRVCIHRRETTNDRERFTTYFDAIEQLVRRGRRVLWVSLKGTEWALNAWGLQGRLDRLAAEFPESLIVTSVWPLYLDVVAAFRYVRLLATDSGSMQEEANTLGVPCVTLRFGSDRAESLLAGGNVLAPPLSPDFVAEVIDRVFQEPEKLSASPLYGRDCAARLVDEVLPRVRLGRGLFRTEEESLRLSDDVLAWPEPAGSAELR